MVNKMSEAETTHKKRQENLGNRFSQMYNDSVSKNGVDTAFNSLVTIHNRYKNQFAEINERANTSLKNLKPPLEILRDSLKQEAKTNYQEIERMQRFAMMGIDFVQYHEKEYNVDAFGKSEIERHMRLLRNLSDISLREMVLGRLIRFIEINNYPNSLQGPEVIKDFISKDRARVKNIIHDMAMRRSGPDKRSVYKYDEIVTALTNKYDNPGMTWSALDTPIKENTFSRMWKILQKKVDKIDTK